MKTRTDMYLSRIFLGMTEGGVLVRIKSKNGSQSGVVILTLCILLVVWDRLFALQGKQKSAHGTEFSY